MIVVLGRPGLTADDRLDRPAGRIAVAAAEAGGRVELVGSIGDDADGDSVVTELGQAGVGHAALLRDPAGVTPRSDGPGTGVAAALENADEPAHLRNDDPMADDSLPRLDAADLELGLQYISECQVLVVAEALPANAISVVVDAAAYHDAALVLVAREGENPPDGIPETATVLQAPLAGSIAFSGLVGRYAALLDSGLAPEEAWRDAVDDTGWEQTSD